MDRASKLSGVCALAWALLVLAGFAAMVLLAPVRNYDIYDVEGGMRALAEQPALVIGGQIAFGWAGVALVLMALAFHGWLSPGSHSYTTRAAAVFGSIAGAFFLFFGLVGGFASFELTYLQSVRSPDYVRQAFLPLALMTNRAFAAAITISGLWFGPANWVALRTGGLPRPVAYLGMAAGGIASLGFVLPGGGFGALGLLLSALWGLLTGFRLLRG